MSDPKRLFDDLGEGRLKDLLAAGKSEVPDERQMMALAAKIGIVGGLGGAGAAGAAGGGAGGAGAAGGGAGAMKAGAVAGAAKGALAVKVVGAVAVAGAVGAGTVAVTEHVAPVETHPVGIVATAAPTSAAKSAEPTTRLSPRVDPLDEPAPSATVAKSAPRPSPGDEVKLLERAQDALDRRPDEALALCNEHARAFPNGMLAQEREVIAIQALVKTGRVAEARTRAARFKQRWPGSSHTRRIDAILPP